MTKTILNLESNDKFCMKIDDFQPVSNTSYQTYIYNPVMKIDDIGLNILTPCDSKNTAN